MAEWDLIRIRGRPSYTAYKAKIGPLQGDLSCHCYFPKCKVDYSAILFCRTNISRKKILWISVFHIAELSSSARRIYLALSNLHSHNQCETQWNTHKCDLSLKMLINYIKCYERQFHNGGDIRSCCFAVWIKDRNKRGERINETWCQSYCQTSCGAPSNSAMQSQKAVSAYFISKQILPFGFAEQSCDDRRWVSLV